jgi:predicted nucleotidyltransferase
VIVEALDDEITRRATSIPGISSLLVFGSRARGAGRPDSDLDVAVLPGVGDDPQARRELQTRLAVALAELAPEGRVDVVFLDEASDLLRQRVLEAGRLLICRDPSAFRDLRVRTMREYGDREWVRELTRAAQKRRLERGEPSGRSGRALESLERVGRLSR